MYSVELTICSPPNVIITFFVCLLHEFVARHAHTYWVLTLQTQTHKSQPRRKNKHTHARTYKKNATIGENANINTHTRTLTYSQKCALISEKCAQHTTASTEKSRPNLRPCVWLAFGGTAPSAECRSPRPAAAVPIVGELVAYVGRGGRTLNALGTLWLCARFMIIMCTSWAAHT